MPHLPFSHLAGDTLDKTADGIFPSSWGLILSGLSDNSLPGRGRIIPSRAVFNCFVLHIYSFIAFPKSIEWWPYDFSGFCAGVVTLTQAFVCVAMLFFLKIFT